MDWIVQWFTSPPTQYRLYGRRFLQVKRPNQQYQSSEGDATEDKENNENTDGHRQVTIFNYDVVTIKTDVLTLNQTQPVERDGKWFNH